MKYSGAKTRPWDCCFHPTILQVDVMWANPRVKCYLSQDFSILKRIHKCGREDVTSFYHNEGIIRNVNIVNLNSWQSSLKHDRWLPLVQVFPIANTTMSVCNKWLLQPALCWPPPFSLTDLPSLPPCPGSSAPAQRYTSVIGSGNLIYVSLEIEILTFALYSRDFTASPGRILWALSNRLAGGII